MTADGNANPPAHAVCAHRGCGEPLTGRRRKYCGPGHRAASAAERRSARRRAERAARLAARQDALIDAVERLYLLAPAARSVGVDPSTAYAWMRRDPAFAARVEVARMIASDGHEAHLLAVARAATPDMARIRAAEAVCRRIDANEARRRHLANQRTRQAAAEPPDPPPADCGGALEWARLPLLEAV